MRVPHLWRTRYHAQISMITAWLIGYHDGLSGEPRCCIYLYRVFYLCPLAARDYSDGYKCGLAE
jgi:hypothetical protein